MLFALITAVVSLPWNFGTGCVASCLAIETDKYTQFPSSSADPWTDLRHQLERLKPTCEEVCQVFKDTPYQ
jgi:hypothetical protein